MFTIGVDVGGTFTDFVVLDELQQSLSILKVPSTPDDPSVAILAGLDVLGSRGYALTEVNNFFHGTTVTTNALIQCQGATTGLLLNRGLRGIWQVQSQMRIGPRYSSNTDRPPQLIEDSNVFEVGGRIDRTGAIITALDEEELRRVGRIVKQKNLEALAICFVSSYTNPSHEQRARDLIVEEAPDCRVICSTDILPRIREWPRMSTTVLDAYLEPTLVGYIAALADGLEERGVKTKKTFLMESNGGVMHFKALAIGGRAVQTVLSGPAAAVQAAKRLAEIRGVRNLVTIDIGGTSCDVAFVQDGEALEVTGGTVCGYDLFTPMLEIATIGAGGGTKAWIDIDGRLQVGPDSAGADPGPASYGRGGQDATITDADVVLGYLNPHYFLGGELLLDVKQAYKAISTKVADPIGATVLEAALAMVRVNDVHMADAVQVVAARNGVTLAECELVACGGAGPVHGALVAEELGINRVLVPQSPGVFAALGLLCTDVAQDYVQTDISRLDELVADQIVVQFKHMEVKAFEDYKVQGFMASDVEFVREVDARYAGQGFEVRVVVNDQLDDSSPSRIAAAFHAEHQRVFGHANTSEAVEIVNYRIRAVVRMTQYHPNPGEAEGDPTQQVGVHRTAVFAGGSYEVPVVPRSAMGIADHFTGPIIIEQQDSTVVVPPTWSVEQDKFGTLVLTRSASDEALDT